MVTGAKRKSKISGKFVLIGLIVIPAYFGVRMIIQYSSPVQEVQADSVEEIVPQRSFADLIPEHDITYEVQEADVLTDIFAGHEIPFEEIVRLEQADDVFNFTNVQVGKEVYFSLYGEGSDLRLKNVFYQPDLNRIVKAEQTSGGWVVSEEVIDYQIQEVRAKGMVESSLYLSGLENGLSDKVIIETADIFAWDVDFALDTRTGDEYRIVYEEKYLGEEKISSGKILAAEYVNQGVSFKAFYFQPEGEIGAYFDEEGNSLQKAFLKAPVNYRHVTSGFSNARFHPILGTVMPHNGVDYAAAFGTPIIAVADGTVSRLGWQNGYGNRIEVKHGDRYGSQYSHMSSFVKGMSVGDRIKQGEVVGFVGSTGYSTGNHVHYSMTDRGNYVDPGSIDVPDGEPVAEEYRDQFNTLVTNRMAELEGDLTH